MDIVCAWCKEKLGEKDGDGTSHGICDKCLASYFPHQYEKIKNILEVENINKIYQKPLDKGGKVC